MIIQGNFWDYRRSMHEPIQTSFTLFCFSSRFD